MKTVNLTFNTIQDIFPGKGLSTKYTLLGRMKMIQDDLQTPPQTPPNVAQESSQVSYKITRDFSNLSTCTLGAQCIRDNHRDLSKYTHAPFMKNCVLK